jgi:Fic family protein
MNEFVNRLTPEYLEDVLIRLAHHSSAMEGNTISLPETATIILNQTLPNNSKITKREYFEVLNHEQTFEYVIEQIQNGTSLSVSVMKNIHEKLTDRLQYDKGKFKHYMLKH